jgi:predicted dehydrogenase
MRNGNQAHEPELVLGIVGLGYWGPNLTRVVSEAQGIRLKWICDLDPERLERFGRRYPACQKTMKLDDVLTDGEVDAVLIATPVFTHFDLALASLRAGKHTFVEKPLAPSSEEAEELVELARSDRLTLMCGHTFVYSPPVRAVKDLIERGELGELLFVSSSRVNLGLHQRDVSVVWDLGPHDFSILQYWLAETPATVRTTGRDSIVEGIPDVAFVNLGYESGLVANVELSWIAPGKLRRTVIVGSEKMVVYDDGAAEPVRVFDHGVVFKDPESFGEYQLSYRTGDIVSPKVETHEPLSEEIADFAAAIRGGGTPVASPELATDVVRVAEAADESLGQNGDPVAIATNGSLRSSEVT